MQLISQVPRRKVSQQLTKRIRCNLSSLMDERELSQLKVAEDTGLAIGTIGSLYRSDSVARIDSDTAIVLCNYLQVGLCELFEIVDANQR